MAVPLRMEGGVKGRAMPLGKKELFLNFEDGVVQTAIYIIYSVNKGSIANIFKANI